MIITNIVTAICFAVTCLFLILNLISYFSKNREGRIAFIRGFKKGKCFIIYLLALPLYFIGRMYTENGFLSGANNVLNAIFYSIEDVTNLVVLWFRLESITPLMNESVFYSVAVYFCYVLVVLNAIMFTLSILIQRLWCFSKDVSSRFTKKDMLYVLGNNENNIDIYRSDLTSYKFLVGNISEELSQKLYAQKIAYHKTDDYQKYLQKVLENYQKTNKKHTVIINTKSDEINMMLCRLVIDYLENFNAKQNVNAFTKLKVYVFGSSKFQGVYEDIVSSGYGVIEYVNEYQKIAIDFIDKYPLTAFMNDNHIDYQTSLIKNDVNINVMLVGFGDVNRQIFLTSVANNQFLTSNGENIENKRVKYVIFDNKNAKNNKVLNHDYYRYLYESKDFVKSEYLPLPNHPAIEEFCKLDVNDEDFYLKIRSIVTANKNDVNIVIVSYSDDIENIDMAQKLIEKRREWDIDNLQVFVRVKKWNKNQTILKNEDCVFIGNEKEIVYNINKITNDKIFNMAMMRNKLYDLERYKSENKNSEVDKKTIERINAKHVEKWFTKKTYLERESGLYCSLSLRSKLHLMGLDYVKFDEQGKALTEEEYFNVYAVGDMPNFVVGSDGTKVIKYPLTFKQSKRRNLAEQEHERWNSFMISKGVIPASINIILTEKVKKDGEYKFTNGKNYCLRRHGNITTLDGLSTFSKLIAKRDGVSEEVTEVFKYDFQLLDEAYTLLTNLGYKIIKK